MMSGQVDITIIIPSAPDRNADDILANLKKVAPKNLHIEVLIIKGTWPPLQRNVGIKEAKGKYIIFFDDDIIVPPGAIEEALKTFHNNKEIAVVGGPNLTPLSDDIQQHCFGEAHASLFTGLHTSVRYKKVYNLKEVNENHLITCNLAFKANVLKENPFGTDIYANEENELLGRLIRKGYKLAYNPEFFVYHHRRPTIRKYVKQIMAWGAGRTMHTIKHPDHLDLTFFVPLIFFFYMIGLLVYQATWYQIPIIVYIFLAIGFSLQIALRERNIVYFILMPWIFLGTHLSYGLGLFLGFFQVSKQKKLPDPKSFQIHRYQLNN